MEPASGLTSSKYLAQHVVGFARTGFPDDAQGAAWLEGEADGVDPPVLRRRAGGIPRLW